MPFVCDSDWLILCAHIISQTHKNGRKREREGISFMNETQFLMHTWQWCCLSFANMLSIFNCKLMLPNWIKRTIYVLWKWKWFNMRLIAFWSFNNRENFRHTTESPVHLAARINNNSNNHYYNTNKYADIGAHAQTHAPIDYAKCIASHVHLVQKSNALDILILGQTIIASCLLFRMCVWGGQCALHSSSLHSLQNSK